MLYRAGLSGEAAAGSTCSNLKSSRPSITCNYDESKRTEMPRSHKPHDAYAYADAKFQHDLEVCTALDAVIKAVSQGVFGIVDH